jgi:hypothetical protein
MAGIVFTKNWEKGQEKRENKYMIIKKQQKQKVEREGKRAGVLLFNIQSF